MASKRTQDTLRPTFGLPSASTPDKPAHVPAQQPGAPQKKRVNRFGSMRGKADIAWRTDELMALLRGR